MFNNGKGIPVALHKVEKMYVPELIFGTLLTSSNYDDSERKVTGDLDSVCNHRQQPNVALVCMAKKLYLAFSDFFHLGVLAPISACSS